MSETHCLILFARSPEPGKVKTRLAARLGDDAALALYRRMLGRQIGLVNTCPGISRQCWVAGDSNHPDLQAFDGDIFRQQGADLGERMHKALAQALTDHTAAVLIGCDCPGLDHEYLKQAFTILSEGTDVVLGPATDGGYVLVGMRRGNAAMFSGIDWGSPQVLEQTRVSLQRDQISFKEMLPLADIDDPEDLDLYREQFGRVYDSPG